MQISVQTGELLSESVDLAVLALCEDEALPAGVADLLEAGDFRGRARQSLLLYPRGAASPRRLLLLGLGKRANVSADTVRQAAALAVQKAQELQVSALAMGLHGGLSLAPALAGQAFAEGAELGGYRYLQYKTGLSGEQTFQVEALKVLIDAGDPAPIGAGIAAGQAIARGVAFARDLANGPGNDITPTKLGEAAEELGARLGLKATVLNKAQLTEQGFGGILAVGQGSAQEPRFIVLEHGAKAAGLPTICLVGKGITFDTGGISIKPAEKMDDMKMDMGGAAAVLGAMHTVGELKPALHVVGIVCAAENMPSSTAYKPGDIVKTLSGKTIEVLNTDAEGRLVLADANEYVVSRYKPAALVNIATLTGSIVAALNDEYAGLFARDEKLATALLQSGEATGESLWRMPLHKNYADDMKSDIADIKNVVEGGGPGAGLGAHFVGFFVGEGTPWAHLDIAGVNWNDRGAPITPKGASGFGVMLFDHLARQFGTR